MSNNTRLLRYTINIQHKQQRNNKIIKLSVKYSITDSTPPNVYNISVIPNPAEYRKCIINHVNATDNVNLTKINATLLSNTILLTYNTTTGLYDGNFTAPSEGIYYINFTTIDWNNITVRNSTQLNVTSSNAELTLSSNDITYSPDNPIDNTTITINATINNYGNADANNFKVELLIDAFPISNNTLYVKANSNNKTQFTWNTTYGNHTISIKTDATSLITESNESNNLINKSIYVYDATPPVINNIIALSVIQSKPTKNKS